MLHALDLGRANPSGGGSGRLHIDFHRSTANAAHGLKSGCRLAVDFFCDVRVIGRKHQLHIDIGSINRHIAEQPKRNDITRKAGIFHSAERLTNGILIDGRHGRDSARSRPAGKIVGLQVASQARGD